nr:hypothetical protein [Tanacetum cinerariifolium]
LDAALPLPGGVARQADHRRLAHARAHQPALVEHGDRRVIGQPPGEAGGIARRRHRAAAAVGQPHPALEGAHEQVAAARHRERDVATVGQ